MRSATQQHASINDNYVDSGFALAVDRPSTCSRLVDQLLLESQFRSRDILLVYPDLYFDGSLSPQRECSNVQFCDLEFLLAFQVCLGLAQLLYLLRQLT